MKIIISIFIFILGCSISSFLGVVSYRVPKHISIIKPDSYCPNCNKPLKWYDNIPILSYIILRGKCRYCHTKIPFYGFILELVGGIFYLLSYLLIEDYISLILTIIIISLLILISYQDYETHYILDLFQFILAIFVIILILYNSLKNSYIPYDNFIGFIISLSLFILIKLFYKYCIKHDSLGTADIILFSILGLLVGYKKILIILLVSSISGLIIELIKNKITESNEIAFGPYLSLGGIIALLFGDMIINSFMEVINAII